MALTIDGSDPSGDLGDLLDDKLDVATAVSDYLPIAGGKVLQIVRATDATDRTTTSTSFVDASISVTITPQKSTSAVLLIWIIQQDAPVGQSMSLQITDNANNAISGAENLVTSNLTVSFSLFIGGTIIAYATPATTSAVTFKGRFKSQSGNTAGVRNATNTGQLYAIEVSA